MRSTTIFQYSIVLFLLARAVMSQDFVVLEPQTRTYNMNENVTVRIYHDREEEELEELIEILNCTDCEVGKGYLEIEMSSVIHNLNGLAALSYKVVGYGRDPYYYDRWTLQKKIKQTTPDSSADKFVSYGMFNFVVVLLLLLNKEF